MVSPVSAVGLAVPPIAPIIVGAELVVLGIIVARRITKGGSKASPSVPPSQEDPRPAPTNTTTTGDLDLPPYFGVKVSHKQELNDVKIKVIRGKTSADVEFKDWVLHDPVAFANIAALITTLMVPGHIPGTPAPTLDLGITRSQVMSSAALLAQELHIKYKIPKKEAMAYAMKITWTVFRDLNGNVRSA